MTLLPRSDFKDASVQALDDRRVYEIYPGAAASSITDFENRKISSAAGKLEISGPPARIIVRWRFAHPSAVTVNGQHRVDIVARGDAASVEFEHRGTSRLNWQ
jgi:hypothetical protein